jgi:hypothetical protein
MSILPLDLSISVVGCFERTKKDSASTKARERPYEANPSRAVPRTSGFRAKVARPIPRGPRRLCPVFHSLGESAGELCRNDALPGPCCISCLLFHPSVTSTLRVRTSTVKKSTPTRISMCERIKSFREMACFLLGAGQRPCRLRMFPTV